MRKVFPLPDYRFDFSLVMYYCSFMGCSAMMMCMNCERDKTIKIFIIGFHSFVPLLTSVKDLQKMRADKRETFVL